MSSIGEDFSSDAFLPVEDTKRKGVGATFKSEK